MDLRKLQRIKDDSVADVIESRIDVNQLISMLKSALAEELNAWYQYWIVAPFMVGTERANIEKLFEENAEDELNDHAVKLRDRLNELGADLSDVQSPDLWSSTANLPYLSPESPYRVLDLLNQNIESEKGAIKNYQALCDFTRGKDYKTYSIVKGILDDEEEHLQALLEFKADITI